MSTLVGHQNRVLCVMVKEGEDLCASGGADHSVKIWDLKKLKLKSTLYGHTVSMTSCSGTSLSASLLKRHVLCLDNKRL